MNDKQLHARNRKWGMLWFAQGRITKETLGYILRGAPVCLGTQRIVFTWYRRIYVQPKGTYK